MPPSFRLSVFRYLISDRGYASLALANKKWDVCSGVLRHSFPCSPFISACLVSRSTGCVLEYFLRIGI